MKRFQGPSYDEAARGNVRLVIVPRGYPEERIDEDRVDRINDSVLDLVESKPGEYVPSMINRYIVDGAFHVICEGEPDVVWLRTNVSQLAPWEEADLSVKGLDELPKWRKMVIYVKTKKTGPEILKSLNTFNRGLETDK